jgi:hypothetical protein
LRAAHRSRRLRCLRFAHREDAFPGDGEITTQVWRIKQLEYTWLRSLMRRWRLFVSEAGKPARKLQP